MPKKLISLILTAGKGKRMKSKLIKNLHVLESKPIISHLAATVEKLNTEDIAFVIGNDAEKVKDHLGDKYTYIYQHEQLGTGHAVMVAKEYLERYIDSNVLVFLGDGPLVTEETLINLLKVHTDSNATATLLTSIKENPTGCGRIIRDAQGLVKRTVEEKDANDEEKKIKEVWDGICCFKVRELLETFDKINNDNAQGEYYLPDMFKYQIEKGYKVLPVKALTNEETLNVNDRMSLANAEKYLNNKTLNNLMKNGVTIVSPETTFIHSSVKIAKDTTILPFTYVTGNSTIGSDCVIGPYTHIEDCEIADSVTVERSTLKASKVDSGVIIGPFAYLRLNTHVKSNGKIGRFVELKKSVVGVGSKVPHLSYVGDTDMGDNVNMGAGSIVVNYDGVNKHRTTIEDNAFVGCNSNLVAPVKIEEGAYVAAGSTVTDNVPAKALAIARNRQVNKEDWVVNRKISKKGARKN